MDDSLLMLVLLDKLVDTRGECPLLQAPLILTKEGHFTLCFDSGLRESLSGTSSPEVWRAVFYYSLRETI